MAEPVPMKRPPLPQHADIPPDVREKAGALASRMNRIQQVLTKPSALPAMKAGAKDELVVLSKEALALWSLI